jgi:hypothetical protein
MRRFSFFSTWGAQPLSKPPARELALRIEREGDTKSGVQRISEIAGFRQ